MASGLQNPGAGDRLQSYDNISNSMVAQLQSVGCMANAGIDPQAAAESLNFLVDLPSRGRTGDGVQVGYVHLRQSQLIPENPGYICGSARSCELADDGS